MDSLELMLQRYTGTLILVSPGLRRVGSDVKEPQFGGQKTTQTEREGSYKKCFWGFPMSWAIEPDCRILLFVWSLWPLMISLRVPVPIS